MFHWLLSDGADGAHVQICRDHACSSVLVTFDTLGASGLPPSDLPSGVLFWRAFGRNGMTTGVQSSPTWELTVGHRNARRDTSWGSILDVNADGYADMFVGQREVGTGAQGSAGQGHAYLYLGGIGGLAAEPAMTLPGIFGTGSLFGTSVGTGDFDGDGYADLVIGAPGLGGGGAIVEYRGGPDGLSPAPEQVFTAPDPADTVFGMALAGAGDVNGDGYADA
jgi:hypothetical protein